MSFVLKFEAITTAPYTAAEKEALEEAFIDFVNGIDGDVIDGTEDVSVIENNKNAEPVISDEVRATVIREFLDSVKIEFDLNLQLIGEDTKPVDETVFNHRGFAQA